MGDLRKVEKAVKEYIVLLSENQENAKKYQEEYRLDVEGLIAFIERYIDDTAEDFQKWCDICVCVFVESDKTLFQRIKNKINTIIVNHMLNRLTDELHTAGIIQDELTEILKRFNQFKYYT